MDVTEDMMLDAGLTDYEIRHPYESRTKQVGEGFKWMCGSWRKVTPADAVEWREGAARAKAIAAEKRTKLDLAFATEKTPGVSHILGSDWGPRYGDYKTAAYKFLEDTSHFEARQLAAIERILARMKVAKIFDPAVSDHGVTTAN